MFKPDKRYFCAIQNISNHKMKSTALYGDIHLL